MRNDLNPDLTVISWVSSFRHRFQTFGLSLVDIEVPENELIVTIDVASHTGTAVLPIKNNSNDTVNVLLQAGPLVTV